MTTETEWTKFLEEDHKILRGVWQENGLSFDENYLYISYFSPSGEFLYKKTRENPSYEGKDKYKYPPRSLIMLYLYHNIKDKNSIILTEGELDTLTLLSLGFPATTAGGVTAFKKEFVSYFKGKKVCICFDNDEPGKKAAQKVANLLANVGIEVWVVDLPEMEGGKDIGDFFRLSHAKDDFMELLKKARKVEPKENTRPSGTETPQGIEKSKLLDQQLTYIEVEEKVLQFLPNSQTALKLVLAVAVSSSFLNPLMLWLLLVGVPSSGKTDIVRLPKDAPTSYYLDNLTQNSFISGERITKDNKVYDLLPLLDKKCFIVKDWTSIFSLDEKMTKKLLGDLVGIYDKEFAKFSSRRGNVTYRSAFSQLGCITPATLNKHAHYLNMVGPRFLCYIMPSSTQESEDQSYEMIFSEQDRAQLEETAKSYASSYLSQLTKQSFNVKSLDKNIQRYLRIATGLMAKCRGIAILQSTTFKNEKGNDATYYEVLEIQIEEPWRAIQQLMTLAKYLAFVVGKNEVGIEELTIIKSIVLSSMPADRAVALKAMQDSDGQITAKQLSESSDKSTKTSRRLLDELTALKVLNKIPGSGTTANDYQIKKQFRNFLLLDPTEFLSHKEDSGTETPHNTDQPTSEPTLPINTLPGLEDYGEH